MSRDRLAQLAARAYDIANAIEVQGSTEEFDIPVLLRQLAGALREAPAAPAPESWVQQAEAVARPGAAVSRDVLRHFLGVALREMLVARTQRGGFQQALERQSLLVERLSALERVAYDREAVETLTPEILSQWLTERRAFAGRVAGAAPEPRPSDAAIAAFNEHMRVEFKVAKALRESDAMTDVNASREERTK